MELVTPRFSYLPDDGTGQACAPILLLTLVFTVGACFIFSCGCIAGFCCAKCSAWPQRLHKKPVRTRADRRPLKVESDPQPKNVPRPQPKPSEVRPQLDLTEQVGSRQGGPDAEDTARRRGPGPLCPLCDKVMTFRSARLGGFFWGCSAFPACKGSRRPRDDGG